MHGHIASESLYGLERNKGVCECSMLPQSAWHNSRVIIKLIIVFSVFDKNASQRTVVHACLILFFAVRSTERFCILDCKLRILHRSNLSNCTSKNRPESDHVLTLPMKTMLI